jgi:hypothetical protein
MRNAGGVSRWTRYFAVASAVSMVFLQVALLLEAPRRAVTIIGLFGAVLPMVFGMAYLLLPSYVGRTLSWRRLAGVHFAAAYVGAGILATDALVGLSSTVVVVGAGVWSLGVAVFVGTLARTVVPAVVADPHVVLRSEGRPQRSSRLATLAIPVALGYLVVGTVALLSTFTDLPDLVGATAPAVVHYYGAGFVALLIFALGLRLLTGFFHVAPPRVLAWPVLLAGSVAPALLAATVWGGPWFRIGAGLEVVAVLGYLAIVGVVAVRTDRRRVGLYGVVLGGIGGAVAVGAAALFAVDVGYPVLVAVHVPLVLDGFLLTTIVGYAYLFFPVTNGQFRGANERTALATMLALASGVGIGAFGTGFAAPEVRTSGFVLTLFGTLGYAYLLVRRLSPL